MLSRLRAFLGAAPDTNLESPWHADPEALAESERQMFQALRDEEQQRLLAANAQREDDAIMAAEMENARSRVTQVRPVT